MDRVTVKPLAFSRRGGTAALGAAFDEARREIDAALGSDDPLDE
jgi:hypothetical protein